MRQRSGSRWPCSSARKLLLLPITGLVADRMDRRKLLMLTQIAMAILGLGMAAVTLTGVVTLWMVFAFALGLGIAAAFDAPARQAFVSDLVPAKHLSNAVALDSASFNGARLVGPAVAGCSSPGRPGLGVPDQRDHVRRRPHLARTAEGAGLHRPSTVVAQAGSVARRVPLCAEAERHRAGHDDDRDPRHARIQLPDLHLGDGPDRVRRGRRRVRHPVSVIAIGSVTGALLSARRDRPRLRTVTLASAGFGASMTAAALMPNPLTFGLALVLVGFSGLTVMTTANGYVQTTTAPAMRGRVMGLYIAVFMGGTPIGAPLAGWVADAFGPRWSLGSGRHPDSSPPASPRSTGCAPARCAWDGTGTAAGRSRCGTGATRGRRELATTEIAVVEARPSADLDRRPPPRQRLEA